MKYEIRNLLALLTRMSELQIHDGSDFDIVGNVIISFPLFLSAGSRRFSKEREVCVGGCGLQWGGGQK